MPSKIIAYLAISVDGFIATADGGVDWLNTFEDGDSDTGYKEFIETIDTVIMGRKTFEQVLGFDGGWPYAGKKAIIISSKPIDKLPELGCWHAPCDIPDIVKEIKEQNSSKDVWLVGGSYTLDGFLKIDAVDILEIYVMPMLLKGGIPLFINRSESQLKKLQLKETKSWPNGTVKLLYNVK